MIILALLFHISFVESAWYMYRALEYKQYFCSL